MAKTETLINEFKINYLTEEQYQAAVANGEINANELYLTPSSEVSTEHTHDEYMAISNPVGTGSLSMNRKSGTTVGNYSVALGYNCEASGSYSFAGGYGSVASDLYSHAEGASTASGQYSHAEGASTASGQYSHAEGKATASGQYSHAEGTSTANGHYSHAEGAGSFANGERSHAEGTGTVASGQNSHAEGASTKASGTNSHAGGYGTEALDYQYAIGRYNSTSSATAGASTGTSGTAFVIGNGMSSSAANAFRVQYNGGVYGKASYSSTGADYAEFFEWLDGNANDEDRRGYFVTLDGEKIKIAESNDYILGVVSGLPSVIGNGDEEWRGRYIMDEFGAFIYEDFEYEEEIQEEVMDEETGKLKIVTKTVTKVGQKFKENPEYDSTLPYVQREDRPEWDAVGMIGVLSVRDDGTCQVNGYCNLTDGGIATASDTGYRVVKRVTDNIIKIIFR